MKNSSEACDKGNVENRGKIYKCSFCEKVFDKYQALGGHQRAHREVTKQLVDENQPIPPIIPMDVTQSNLDEHGNSSRYLSKATIDFIPVSKGNHYDNFTQGDNNASKVAPLQSNGTSPFTLLMGHPIYIGPSSNPVGSASSASFIANHHFNGDNSQSSIGYHMGPNPFLVDTNSSAQISIKANKSNNGEVQEQLSIINRNMEQNKGLNLFTNDAQLENTTDANLKDGHAFLHGDPSTRGSVKESTHHAKEENANDLDLSLHL